MPRVGGALSARSRQYQATAVSMSKPLDVSVKARRSTLMQPAHLPAAIRPAIEIDDFEFASAPKAGPDAGQSHVVLGTMRLSRESPPRHVGRPVRPPSGATRATTLRRICMPSCARVTAPLAHRAEVKSLAGKGVTEYSQRQRLSGESVPERVGPPPRTRTGGLSGNSGKFAAPC